MILLTNVVSFVSIFDFVFHSRAKYYVSSTVFDFHYAKMAIMQKIFYFNLQRFWNSNSIPFKTNPLM